MVVQTYIFGYEPHLNHLENSLHPTTSSCNKSLLVIFSIVSIVRDGPSETGTVGGT